VRCTVQHQDWKTHPGRGANVCANETDGWVITWPEISRCVHSDDIININIFLAMKNETDLLDPPLDKG